MISAQYRPDPARNGRVRAVAARSLPLAAWAACSKWSARSRIFPWTSTTWSMRVMKFRQKFLLLHHALLDALIPDLPVSPAEAVGVARFCSPNLVRFIFGPPSYHIIIIILTCPKAHSRGEWQQQPACLQRGGEGKLTKDGSHGTHTHTHRAALS